MGDPRIALGCEVEPEVVGPFEVRPAQRDGSGDDGGALDIGIVARTRDDTRVIIGEIWAACPNNAPTGKTRIDAEAVATAIVDALNRAPLMPAERVPVATDGGMD